MLRPDGTSDFQALQNLMRDGDESRIMFFAFDLLYHGGHDLSRVPLIKQKPCSRSCSRARKSRTIRFSDQVTGPGRRFFNTACGHGLEGVVAKLSESPYVQGRTSTGSK